MYILHGVSLEAYLLYSLEEGRGASEDVGGGLGGGGGGT